MEVNKNDYKKTLARMRERKDRQFQTFATHGARYSVVAQTYSNLKMSATVEQSSFEPSADLTFQAVLTEYDIPVEKRAQVQVELTRPNGSVITLPMSETEPGTFELTFKATYAGIYHARTLACGVTLRGALFTREQLLDAAVWKGGDHPYQPPRDTGKDGWCQLLNCLLSDKNLSRKLSERLKKEGINFDDIRQCIEAYCRSADRTRDPR